jgi:hypothetical protein
VISTSGTKTGTKNADPLPAETIDEAANRLGKAEAEAEGEGFEPSRRLHA